MSMHPTSTLDRLKELNLDKKAMKKFTKLHKKSNDLEVVLVSPKGSKVKTSNSIFRKKKKIEPK